MLLWLLVLVLLLRGLAGVLSPREVPAASPVPKAASPVWPDDAARAFAADFARAYLSFTPSDPEASAKAIQAFVSPELASSISPQTAEHAKAQSVSSVSVARITRLDDEQALVTVAAAVNGSTRYLTVPVARDAHGGLVVSELPSFTAPPARATVAAAATEAVPAAERAAIEDVTSRYLRAYVGGDAGVLKYLAPAGTQVAALAQKLELVDVDSLALAAPPQGGERLVLASARVRDPATETTFELLYRLRLVNGDGDQWLVASVNDSTHKGG
jgi:hypothetical protein